MATISRQILCLVFISLFCCLISCEEKKADWQFNASEFSKVELVLINPPSNSPLEKYRLEKSEINEFIEHLNNSALGEPTKESFCYELRLLYPDGRMERFSTNGQEIIHNGQNYRWYNSENFISQFWKIRKEQFCNRFTAMN